MKINQVATVVDIVVSKKETLDQECRRREAYWQSCSYPRLGRNPAGGVWLLTSYRTGLKIVEGGENIPANKNWSGVELVDQPVGTFIDNIGMYRLDPVPDNESIVVSFQNS